MGILSIIGVIGGIGFGSFIIWELRRRQHPCEGFLFFYNNTWDKDPFFEIFLIRRNKITISTLKYLPETGWRKMIISCRSWNDYKNGILTLEILRKDGTYCGQFSLDENVKYPDPCCDVGVLILWERNCKYYAQERDNLTMYGIFVFDIIWLILMITLVLYFYSPFIQELFS